jgi:hypothetical protein
MGYGRGRADQLLKITTEMAIPKQQARGIDSIGHTSVTWSLCDIRQDFWARDATSVQNVPNAEFCFRIKYRSPLLSLDQSERTLQDRLTSQAVAQSERTTVTATLLTC